MKKILFPLMAVVLFTFQQCEEVLTQPDIEKLAFNADLVTASFEMSESDETQSVTIEFDQELPTSLRLNVTVSGTAVYGEDYTTTLDEVEGGYFISIPEGATTKSFSITPIDNQDPEDGDRTAIFSVASDDDRVTIAAGAEITVTITNDDFVTPVEAFLMSSVKTTYSYQPMNCYGGGIPAFGTEYNNDGMPIGVYLEFPNTNIGRRGIPTETPRVDFSVEYDETSIWFAYESDNFDDINNNPPLRMAGPGEGPMPGDVFLTAEIADGKIASLTTSLGFFGRGVKVQGESFPETVTTFSYDDSGRTSSINFVTSGINFNGPPSGETSYDFTYNSETEVVAAYSYDLSNTSVPDWTLTLDGKNNPFDGFAALPIFMAFNTNFGYGSAPRYLFHAVLPSNWVSGLGPLQNNYSYNADDYPTSSTSDKQGFNEEMSGQVEENQTYEHVFQYEDMESGVFVDPGEYCQNECCDIIIDGE